MDNGDLGNRDHAVADGTVLKMSFVFIGDFFQGIRQFHVPWG
jgi:hypothetical protein